MWTADPTICPVRAEELASLVTERWRPFAEEMAAMGGDTALAADSHEARLEAGGRRVADADCETVLALADDPDGADGRADGPAVGPDGCWAVWHSNGRPTSDGPTGPDVLGRGAVRPTRGPR